MELLKAARKVAAESVAPWVAVTVWGFQDTPVSWAEHEHGFLNSGDNGYTVVVFGDGRYWLFAAVATWDTFSL
jgi:ribonuclease P/MRP protein subunit RPP40